METLKEISLALEKITYSDREELFRQLLTALRVSGSTIGRLISKASKNGYHYPIYLYTRAAFIFNDQLDSSTVIRNFEENRKQPYRLIVVIAIDKITVKDAVTGEIVISSLDEVHLHARVFLPLVFKQIDERDLSTTIDLAELSATLFNHLMMNDTEDQSQTKKNAVDFIVCLIYCSFFRSAMDDKSIQQYLSWIHAESNGNQSYLMKGFLSQVFGRKANSAVALPHWSIDELKEISVPRLDVKGLELATKILCYPTLDISPETLGSLIYRFTKEDDRDGIYGHFTSSMNVSKVLNPLILDKYQSLINVVKGNHKDLEKIGRELSELTFFDPTNGPGCFLTCALSGVVNLIEQINSEIDQDRSIIIDIGNFIALTDDYLSQKLSHLTLWVAFIQYKRTIRSLSKTDLSDLFSQIKIYYDDQLTSSWEKICPNHGKTMIIGSPLFRGSKKISTSQRIQMEIVFGSDKLNEADYCSSWLLKAAKYIKNSTSASALVLTNSICQGVQVSFIWSNIYKQECEISFSYRSFKWKNSTKQSTGVSVIIIGLTSNQNQPTVKQLFTDGQIVKTNVIGPYLIDATKEFVVGRREPLSSILPLMIKGNMPYDKQHLLFTREEKDQLIRDEHGSITFLKRIVGSEEFIKGIERWCLWIESGREQEALSLKEIAERVERVRTYRLSKTDKGAQKLAERPYQFREFRATDTQTLVIPSVSSERRPYIPIGFIGKETVVSNLAFAIYNCEPWIFGIISSRMHTLWIRTVCGSLETRIRYSSQLGYNTFPFPEISEDKKNHITNLVFEIIKERETHCEISLGNIYNNLPERLRMLHELLDLAIDSCYQLARFNSDSDRLRLLFNLYSQKNI